MKQSKSWFRRTSHFRLSPPLLQPMTLALVFLLFAALFFVTAMMDLRRLETLLLETLRNKAIYVLEVTHKASDDKFRRLASTGYDFRNSFAGLFVEDEKPPLQVILARLLLEKARAAGANADSPDQSTVPEGFRSVVLMDAKGECDFRGQPVSSEVLNHAKDLIATGNEMDFHLFHGMSRADYSGLVGIRRESGKGVVLLVLDREDLMSWLWKVAVQTTVQEMQWGQGVVYLVVEDAAGNILAQSGSLPEEEVGECLLMASAVRDPQSPVGQCVKVGSTKFLELSIPFEFEKGTAGIARVGLETHETDRILFENRQHILLWTGLMVGIGLFAMALLYRTQNRHISRIQAIQERLHQAEKLSALGKLGAGVAHEIRNPLNAISLAVQRLRKDFRPAEPAKEEPYDRITHILGDEIQRLNGIVEEFLSLSRTSRLDLRPQSVVDLLDRILALLQEEARERGVELQKRWSGSGHPVLMDAHKMEQALLNILRNALESITREGVVVVSCDEPGEEMTRIRIRDNGRGIRSGEENLVFDPFYTTKANGVGLGLAIAHEIIAAHGGEIRVGSRPNLGTTFEILLPQWTGES